MMNKKQMIAASIVAILVTMLACGLVIKEYLDYNDLGFSKADLEKDIEAEADEIKIKRLNKLTDEENRELLDAYKVMKEKNPEFAGFVRIEGTEMAYPVMYSPKDPEKYLHMDINGVEADNGLPFIDTRCKLEPDSDNIIIYGHNMKDGSMFSSIISYQDRSFYEEHPVIRFDSLDEVREYEVMSVFYDRVYYTDEIDVFKFYDFIDSADEADYYNAVEQYLKKSIYDTGVRAEYGDKLITLVTCAYHTENGRFVVVARRKD